MGRNAKNFQGSLLMYHQCNEKSGNVTLWKEGGGGGQGRSSKGQRGAEV